MDAVVGERLLEALTSFSTSSVYWLVIVMRVVVVVVAIGLAALVVRGPRSRAAGIVMTLLGFYFGVLPPLAFFYLADTLGQMPPFTDEVLRTTDFRLWVATAVMLLGLVELAWPSAATSRTSAAPRFAIGQP